ncbi:MAG: prepilin-type N-terminal cleavage/methylation domain-containing protein [Actinomycetes bacterium]
MDKAAREDAGFTLVEMLVVLVIMGVLAGVTYVGLTSSRSNSLQNSCRTAYQALSLGVSAYQSDNNGTLPTSVTSLQPTYLNAGLVNSYANNFSLQLGAFAVTNEALSGKTATLQISSSFLPPIAIGGNIQVSGVDSTNLDGTWVVTGFSGSSSPYTVTYTATSAATIASTAVSSKGAVLNSVTNAQNSYDVYLYNATIKNRIGTTAPSACALLN